MKTIKSLMYMLLVIFIIIMIFEVIMMVDKGRYIYSESHILLLSVLSVILIYRNRITWVLMILISFYGIYNLIFRQPIYSMPTNMNFTGILYLKLRNSYEVNFDSIIARTLQLFPLVFYVAGIICFATKHVRIMYHIGKRKDIRKS